MRPARGLTTILRSSLAGPCIVVAGLAPAMSACLSRVLSCSCKNDGHPFSSHQFPSKRLVQDRRHQGVEFGLGLGLQLFQGIYFGVQVIQVGNDALLLRKDSLLSSPFEANLKREKKWKKGGRG